jgi:hypothetical protein
MSRRASTDVRRRTAPAVKPATTVKKAKVKPSPAGRPNSKQRSTGRFNRVLAMLRRAPTAAWVCAFVAFINAASWSLIMPPFQIPDEQDHFAYVQQLAENGTLPKQLTKTEYSFEEIFALQDLNYYSIRRYPQGHTISSRAQEQRLQHDLASPLPRRGNRGAGVATSQPPLYYALQTIPYELGSGGTILDRLELMRLLSALMGAMTALFAFMFVREVLPGVRWAWTVGGLGVALAPLLGYMSGGVNSEVLLYSVSAALLYCFARAFRRGLTPKLGVAMGIATILGFVTKLNFIGLVPGIVLGLLFLIVREARKSRRTALLGFAGSVGIPAVPVFAFILINRLLGRSSFGFTSRAISNTLQRGGFLHEASYIWQLYFPRLPGMANDFTGIFPTRIIWFNGLIGLYGWFDTTFPSWVYTVAIVPASLIAALCIRALIANRSTLRQRLPELMTYLAMCAGLMILVGATSYVYFIGKNSGGSPEPRYLVPLLALWGVVLALAARGAGRRWGPTAGVLIVVVCLAHDIFSQLLVISRYYG